MAKDGKKSKEKNLCSFNSDDVKDVGNALGLSTPSSGQRTLNIFSTGKPSSFRHDTKPRREFALHTTLTKSKSGERTSLFQSSAKVPVSKSKFYTTPIAAEDGCHVPAATFGVASANDHLTGTSVDDPSLFSVNNASPVAGASVGSSLTLPGLNAKQDNGKQRSSAASFAENMDTFVGSSVEKTRTNSLPRESNAGGRRAGYKLDTPFAVGAESEGVGSTGSHQFASRSWSPCEMSAFESHISNGGNAVYRNSNNCHSSPPVLEVGDRVVVKLDGRDFKGVVKWLGDIEKVGVRDQIAGLEMDDVSSYFSDGTFNDSVSFPCEPGKGLFVHTKQCIPLYQDFGGIECPVVVDETPPMTTESGLDDLWGQFRGIQGHYNSCYLDATLFSMFAFDSSFDTLLYRPKKASDIVEYGRVQEVLRDKIVHPLRKNKYVRADRVMELRELLDVLGFVSGLTCEEKDPEEFLTSLLQQTLKAEPFLELSSGQEAYYYQLFVEKHEKINLPTVQYLLEQSFHSSNVKLKQVPPCLIILMPRFGKSFKVYPRIFPPLVLEVTEIIENSLRACSVCGKIAQIECMDCFHESTEPDHRLCAFCSDCAKKTHHKSLRSNHKQTPLSIPSDYVDDTNPNAVQPEYMELFAVVCIETSHYVSFVRCGDEPDAPWCFFDSMADRRGEQNGYNIPEINECPDLHRWLSDNGEETEQMGYEVLKRYYAEGNSLDKKEPPQYVKRLLNDVYLCMYKSKNVTMYR